MDSKVNIDLSKNFLINRKKSKIKTWNEYYKNAYFPLSEYLGNLSAHAPFINEIIKEKPNKILEVGIGTGSMSIFLSHLGYNVIGIDNDKTVLNRARNLNKLLNGNAKFMYCDAFKINKFFKENEFDIVFSQGFFEHFSDFQIIDLLNKQLKVAHRAIIFSVPTKYYGKKDFGNERLLTLAQWKKILNEFQIDKMFEYGGCFSIKNIWWTIGKILRRGIFLCIKIKKNNNI